MLSTIMATFSLGKRFFDQHVVKNNCDLKLLGFFAYDSNNGFHHDEVVSGIIKLVF